MLKKVTPDWGKFKKLKLEDYQRRLPPYVFDKDYKFTFSVFNSRTESYLKKTRKYTLEEASKYFNDYFVLCILYDNEDTSYVNIVLEGNRRQK